MPTTEERRALWRGLLAAHKDSGLPVATWRREHDIQINIFYSWRKRLADPVLADT